MAPKRARACSACPVWNVCLKTWWKPFHALLPRWPSKTLHDGWRSCQNKAVAGGEVPSPHTSCSWCGHSPPVGGDKQEGGVKCVEEGFQNSLLYDLNNDQK